jgi:hypothetical protein
MAEARAHHYEFAHRLLPGLFLSDPDRFLRTLEGGDVSFLEFLWDDVGKKLDPSEVLQKKGLQYTIRSIDEYSTAVFVTMPPPDATPEAYFVALTIQKEDPGLDTSARCLTLEYSMDFQTEMAITVLGEWTLDGKHLNLGLGPEPTEGEFVSAVMSLVDH